jgi:RNA polymerase sigma-70 factor (ECF subfamily)
MAEESDEALMLRIARGDERAFRALAPRYATRAVGLARRICGNASDAEEIVQEAFLRVWVNAPRWRPEALFRTWFYRIVFNLALNKKRRAPFFPLEAAGDPADPAPRPDAILEQSERARHVAAAIAALPARQRSAIALSYGDGMSNAEAAAVLGTSVSAFETILVRARRTLRVKLDWIQNED